MMKCNACGSTEIDVDPSRADAVCTACGQVLESSIIVSDIQFEENSHGGASAIGTFVSSESKGGTARLGIGGFSPGMGLGRESREITLRNARKKIEALSQQLSLRRDRVDMAFHFFKLALSQGLTRGRKSTHVIAACVYITCRTEGTSHMLIDFSDILQIDVYELGRTYLRLSQALCINIPAMDPCLYVMRFAHKLEFGEKTHEVSMTALRIVSRMKKDWIHFGRRPSGLCGAALLIASRLHMFNRTVGDVIKIVKVHESTLRKRLNEFGETPASQLTLDEFMTIDLDAMTEEMDPPSFKVARKKDRERLIRLEEEEDLDKELSDLEKQIEKELEDRKKKRKSRKMKGGIDKESQSLQERDEEERFIAESTLETISECVIDNKKRSLDSKLMPPPNSSSTAQHVTKPPVAVSPGIGLKDTIHEYLVDHTAETEKVLANVQALDDDEELDLVGIDENEIDGYIMSDNEIKYKTELWMKVNAEYLKEKAVKEEKERIEAELAEKEGRDPKKRKKSIKKNKVNLGANSTALEAIEKIVQEKKISTKINYDVLKSLNTSFESKHTPKVTLSASSNTGAVVVESVFGEPPLPTPDGISSIFTLGSSSPAKRPRLNTASQSKIKKPSPLLNSISSSHAQEKENSTLPSHLTRLMMLNNNGDSESKSKDVVVESEPVIESGPIQLSTPMHASVAEEEDEDFDEEEEEPEDNHLSVAQLLSQHRGENAHEDFEEEYY